MDNSLRRRRVSLPQLECLWKFLDSHKEIATGYNKCATSRETSKRLWKAIALNLNSFDCGATKSCKDWTRYWNNYKSKLRLKIAALKSRNGSGNLPIDWDNFAEIEKKFILILGKKFKSLIDGEMEAFEEPESSDNSLDSVYDPKTVPDLKAESITTKPNPKTSHSESSDSQTSSVFQQIFIDEDSGDKSEVNGQTSSNGLSSHKMVEKREAIRDTAASSSKSNESIQRGSVRESKVWPKSRSISQRPRRRQLYRSEMPLELDRALEMIVRDSRRKTVVMERLLQEVINIKELLKARLPPPPVPPASNDP